MGFADQLQEIIRRLPETRQTLLFSATLPKLLVEFARAGETHSHSQVVDDDDGQKASKNLNFNPGFLSLTFPGLTEPVLIRLDVDSKLSDQIKVKSR